MKTCENPKCAKPFEPKVTQRYCCFACGNRVRVKNARKKKRATNPLDSPTK